MRISVRVVSNQDCWYPRFPKIDLDSCYPQTHDENERFHEDDFRRQVRDCPFVTIASDDEGAPLAFGAILIASVNDWLNDQDKDVKGDPKKDKIRERLNRKLERGTFSFVRIDITGVRVEWNKKTVRGVKVRITTDDRDVVQRRAFEREFAMVVADFCRCYSNLYVSRGDPALVFAPETQQLIDDLHNLTVEIEEKERVRKSNEERFICPHYRNGYCTSDADGNPPRFDCEHYCKGQCIEIERTSK